MALSTLALCISFCNGAEYLSQLICKRNKVHDMVITSYAMPINEGRSRLGLSHLLQMQVQGYPTVRN
jgi:hypothetical protein